MVQHQSDRTQVDWPEDNTDAGEIFDYILRKGPVSYREIVKKISSYSPDEVSKYLERLEHDGYISKQNGQYYIPDE